MLQKFEIYYPEEVLDELYWEFASNDMDIYTFEEFCFVYYGQYVSEFHHQRKRRTCLLVSTYM